MASRQMPEAVSGQYSLQAGDGFTCRGPLDCDTQPSDMYAERGQKLSAVIAISIKSEENLANMP